MCDDLEDRLHALDEELAAGKSVEGRDADEVIGELRARFGA